MAVRARACAGAAAGEVGVAAGHGRGEVHGVGPWLSAQVAVVIVRELGSAAKAAAGVGREDGKDPVLAVEPALGSGGVFALVVEESDLVRSGVAAQAGQVCIHEQARARAGQCEVGFRELEEVVGVGARAVRQEAPVGSNMGAMWYGALVFDEDTAASVFGAADYKQGMRVRRPRERQGA